jgi:hypothetical protein
MKTKFITLYHLILKYLLNNCNLNPIKNLYYIVKNKVEKKMQKILII